MKKLIYGIFGILGLITLSVFIFGIDNTLISAITGGDGIYSGIIMTQAIVGLGIPLKIDKGFKILTIDDDFKKQANSTESKSLIAFTEKENAEKNKVDSIYDGLSHNEIIKVFGKQLKLYKEGKIDEVKAPAFIEQMIAIMKKNGVTASDKVNKITSIQGSGNVLFQAYLSTMVEVGLLSIPLRNELLFNSTSINELEYSKIVMNDVEDDRKLRTVGQGEDLPSTIVQLGDKSIRLKRRGRSLKTPNGILLAMRVNALQPFIDRCVTQIGIEDTNEILSVLYSGDGNSGTAITSNETYNSATSGSLVDTDVIGFDLKGDDGYFDPANTILVGSSAALTLYRKALSGMLDYPGKQGDLSINQPRQYKWNKGILATTTDIIFKIDTRLAVEEAVQNPGLKVETDRDILADSGVVAISKTNGFAKGLLPATVILDITHA